MTLKSSMLFQGHSNFLSKVNSRSIPGQFQGHFNVIIAMRLSPITVHLSFRDRCRGTHKIYEFNNAIILERRRCLLNYKVELRGYICLV